MGNTYVYTKNLMNNIHSLVSRYRDFLLDAGTLFTVTSGALLIIAVVAYPQNMWSDNNVSEGSGYIFYLHWLGHHSYGGLPTKG